MNTIPPKARTDLQIHQIPHEGEIAIVIEDPLGIISGPLVVTPLAALFLLNLDGHHSVGEISNAINEHFPMLLEHEHVKEIISELSANDLLETPEYLEKRDRILGEFINSAVRLPTLAGVAYPDDVVSLKDWLDSVVDAQTDHNAVRPAFLVVPHIDFNVHSELYGKAYATIRNHQYRRVVVLGTGHSLTEHVYCLSRKSFATPLGVTATDLGAVNRLMESVEGMEQDVFAKDDFAHRNEHSIEMQLLFLQHILGADQFELVPVLCGSLHNQIHTNNALREIPAIESFVDELHRLCTDPDYPTLVVGSVDLSHFGLRFGHEQPARDFIEKVQEYDQQLIDSFVKGNKNQYWELERESQGFFNVCGFSALETILEMNLPVETECLGYDCWDDQSTGSAVSFTGMVGR